MSRINREPGSAPSAASRANVLDVPGENAIRQDAERLRPGGEIEGISPYKTRMEDQIERKLRQSYARGREAMLLAKEAPASVAKATAPAELARPEGGEPDGNWQSIQRLATSPSTIHTARAAYS